MNYPRFIRVYVVAGRDCPPATTPFYLIDRDIDVSVDEYLAGRAQVSVLKKYRRQNYYFWFTNDAELIAFKFRFHNTIVNDPSRIGKPI